MFSVFLIPSLTTAPPYQEPVPKTPDDIVTESIILEGVVGISSTGVHVRNAKFVLRDDDEALWHHTLFDGWNGRIQVTIMDDQIGIRQHPYCASCSLHGCEQNPNRRKNDHTSSSPFLISGGFFPWGF